MWQSKKRCRDAVALLTAGAVVASVLTMAAAPAAADEPDPVGSAGIDMSCTIHPDQATEHAATAAALSYDGERHDVAVNASALQASASSEARSAGPHVGESCSTTVSFSSALVVGPGTSGLADGEPVRLRMTVTLDSWVVEEFSPTDANFQTRANVAVHSTVRDDRATCEGSDPELCSPTAAHFGATHEHSTNGSPPGDWDLDGNASRVGEWNWFLDGNLSEEVGEYARDDAQLCSAWPSCAGWTGAPTPHSEPSGTRTVEFLTQIGSTLTVAGGAHLFTQAWGDAGANVAGRAAVDHFGVVLEPAAGYESIDLAPSTDDGEGSGDGDGGGEVDTTPPTAAATVAPDANAAGWHRSDVTVALSGADDGDGVGSIVWSAVGAQATEPTTVDASTADVVVNAEGETTITYVVTDLAGNESAPQTVTVRVDRTAPIVAAPSVSPAPNGAGWHTTAPTVSMTASDDLSGLASITAGTAKGAATTAPTSPASLTVTDEGETMVLWRATDIAGNVAEGAPMTVWLDRMRPVIRMAPVTVVARSPRKGWLTPIQYQLDAVDDLDPAPVVSCTPATVTTQTRGTERAQCTAIDAAGNIGSTSGWLVVLPADFNRPLQQVCAEVTRIEQFISWVLGGRFDSAQVSYLYQVIRAALPCGGDVTLPSGGPLAGVSRQTLLAFVGAFRLWSPEAADFVGRILEAI